MKYKFSEPLEMPRATHYGSNYWMFESRKLHRRVTAYSNLEYENLLILEMSHHIDFFCEQPYKATVFIGDKKINTIFDVYVVYRDGREEFQEVKYQEEIDSDNSKGERSRNQLVAQKIWCMQNGFGYNLRTDKEIEDGKFYIRNLAYLAAKARRFHINSDTADKAIINYLSLVNKTTIGFLVSSGRFEYGRTIDYLADLYYRGIIDLSDIRNECISNRTEVIFNGRKTI